MLEQVDPVGAVESLDKVIKRRIYETKGPDDIYYLDENNTLGILHSSLC